MKRDRDAFELAAPLVTQWPAGSRWWIARPMTPLPELTVTRWRGRRAFRDVPMSGWRSAARPMGDELMTLEMHSTPGLLVNPLNLDAPPIALAALWVALRYGQVERFAGAPATAPVGARVALACEDPARTVRAYFPIVEPHAVLRGARAGERMFLIIHPEEVGRDPWQLFVVGEPSGPPQSPTPTHPVPAVLPR